MAPIFLPLEICDLFVDALVEDLKSEESSPGSREALLACSYVCRSFWMRARRHTFAEVCIPKIRRFGGVVPFEIIVYDLTRLYMFMTDKAFSITHLIESFSMEVISFDFGESINQPIVSCILREFIEGKSLRELHFFPGEPRNHIIWAKFDEEVKNSLLYLFGSSHLTTLRIHGCVDIPPDMFNDAQIKHLRLISSRSSCPTTSLASLSYPPPLESIEVDNSFLILDKGDKIPPTTFSRLRKLMVRISSRSDMDNVHALILQSHNQLQLLQMTFAGSIQTPSDSFNLAQIPNLREFELIYKPPLGIPNTTEIRKLCDFLQSSAPMHALETVKIEIYIYDIIRSSQTSLIESDWYPLDKALAHPHLRCLRNVSIHLCHQIIREDLAHSMSFVNDEFFSYGEYVLRALFPDTRSSDSIDFKVSISARLGSRGY